MHSLAWILLFSFWSAQGEAGVGRNRVPPPSIQVESDEAEALRRVQKVKQTDPEQAQAIIQKQLLKRRTPALVFELALLRSAAGDSAACIRLFEEVLQLDSRFPGVQKNLGRLHAAQGRVLEAEKALQKGIQQEGPDRDSCALLGECYVTSGKFLQAEEPLRFALMVQPQSRRLLLYLAHALYGQERYGECEKVIQSALEVDPFGKDLWILLANARIADGRAEEAVDAFEALVHMNVDLDCPLLWTLGDLYLNLDLSSAASDVYKKALEKGNPSKEALRNAAAAFLAVGDLKEAKSLSERLLKTYKEDWTAFLVLGEVALNKKKLLAAKNYFKQAVQVNPLCGRALLALGDIAAEEKNSSKAMGYYQTARALKKYEEAALRAEVNLLLQTSRLKEAIKVLDVLRKTYPSAMWDRLAEQIARRLEA